MKENIYNQFKWSLQALAAPTEVQLSLFPDFVVKTDELLLDLDHWRITVLDNYEPDFTTEQLKLITELDQMICNLNTIEEEIWSEKALKTSEFWEQLRIKAKEVLLSLKWPIEIPPSDRFIYVKG